MPILLGSGGVCLFLFLLVFVIVAAAGNDGDSSSSSSTSYTGYTPTSTYSYSPTSTESTSGLPTSTTSTTGTDGGSGPYGTNEENKVYETGSMAGVDCTAKVPSTDPDPYEKYLEEVIPCLNKAWKAQLATQGIAFQEPGVVVARSKSPTSPCTSSDIGYTPTAFYCGVNQTMYFNLSAIKGSPPDFSLRTAPHEYGHHVQVLIGISGNNNQKYEDASGDQNATAEITRRHELQAQCFAALFLGGNAGGMGTSQAAVVRATGGDDNVEGAKSDPSLRTHGSIANNKYWLRQGWPRNASVCNTWTASPEKVA